jgi:hypothetical protein
LQSANTSADIAFDPAKIDTWLSAFLLDRFAAKERAVTGERIDSSMTGERECGMDPGVHVQQIWTG